MLATCRRTVFLHGGMALVSAPVRAVLRKIKKCFIIFCFVLSSVCIIFARVKE